MRKIPPPVTSHAHALAKCLEGVGDPALKARYQGDLGDGGALEARYKDAATKGFLYLEKRVQPAGNGDPVIEGTLKRSELIKLYTQYFVPEAKPARSIYDEIKITANGKCPLCGDIGHVRTLDHYLPKANFPQYAVMPGNLVPCCRDCNSEKLNAFSGSYGLQTLHPYFDDDKYFAENWVKARVVEGAPPIIEFRVSPPENWSGAEKQRVESHFEEYGLALRFSVEAGADIPETILTRRTTLHDSHAGDFSSYLLEKSNNLGLPINNWRRVMFSALARDAWFCNHRH